MFVNNPIDRNSISTNDSRLLDEALDRLQKLHVKLVIDRDSLLITLDAELRRGRRDMFSLLKAGQRAING